MPNETIPVAQITKLAEVKSAHILLGDRIAPGLLEVGLCCKNWQQSGKSAEGRVSVARNTLSMNPKYPFK